MCLARRRADRRPAGVTMDPVTSLEDRDDLRVGVFVLSFSSSSSSSSSSSFFLLRFTFGFVFGTDTDESPSMARKPINAICKVQKVVTVQQKRV